MIATGELGGGGMRYCVVDDCLRMAKKGSYCWAHLKRKQLQRSMNHPVRDRLSPWGRVLEAAIALAEADCTNDHAWLAAQHRMRWAARVWVASIEKRRDIRKP